AFFNLLMDNKLYRDAVRFTAHLLAPHQAVWWGCVCAWAVLRPATEPKQAAAVQATVQWVIEPGEPQRRAAEAAARSAGPDTLGGAVAMSAFYCGDSMAPPNLPAAPPPPYLSAKSVAAV